MRFSVDARDQRVVQCLRRFRGQRAVLFVGDAEHVLGAFAEGRDARILHTQALLAQYVADGGTVADIAVQLGLGQGTVRNHVSAAMTKTGARTRAEAVRIATDSGWL